MKILVAFLVVLILTTGAYAKDSDIEVQSTQGVEINSDIVKSKPTRENINEQKDIKNRSKHYRNKKRQLDRQNIKRIQTQKQINYLEQRLEKKKEKIEKLHPNTVKGEQE